MIDGQTKQLMRKKASRLLGRHSIPCIQGGNLVGLSQGGIIEDILQKVIEFTAKHVDRLADVDLFCCAFTQDMHPKQFAIFQ